jgi:hypothetical protein
MVNPGRLGDRPEAFTGFEPLAGFALRPSLVPRLMAHGAPAADMVKRCARGPQAASPLLSPFGDIDCKETLQSRS